MQSNITLLAKNDIIKRSFANNTFNYIFLNPTSLENKLEELGTVINNSETSIIGISETWYDDSNTNNSIRLNGYKLIRNDRKSNTRTRGGGIAFYIKDGIDYCILKKSHGNCLCQYTFINIYLSYETKICVGIAYNPPDNKYKNKSLLNCLHEMSNQYEHVIFMGDLNINILKLNIKQNTNFINEINQMDLNIINNIPTHFPPNDPPSLLDLIIIKNKDFSSIYPS